MSSLRVSPVVYDAVAAARAGEVARHYPLMLLGLPLVADHAVPTYDPVVAKTTAARRRHADRGRERGAVPGGARDAVGNVLRRYWTPAFQLEG